MNGEKLPPPSAALGFSPAELAQIEIDRAALERDPRTAGKSNRPGWLVRRVLDDAKRGLT